MSKIDWPKELQNSSSAKTLDAIEKAFTENRLGHALIFVAEEIAIADAAARALSAALLKKNLTETVFSHADYTAVQPMNKQRQIGVDAMRTVRDFLQKGSITGTKVVHISQADRLNDASANLFLKILEEPPAGSYIVMTTTEPYAILPTLISRSMRFRLGGTTTAKSGGEISVWSKDFEAALVKGNISFAQQMEFADRAVKILSAIEDAKVEIPGAEEMEEEVLEAMKTARLKEEKKNFFAAMESAALEAYKEAPRESVRLKSAIAAVERAYRLTVFNLNTAAALELAIGGVVDNLTFNV